MRCDKLVDAGRRAFFARTAAVAAGAGGNLPAAKSRRLPRSAPYRPRPWSIIRPTASLPISARAEARRAKGHRLSRCGQPGCAPDAGSSRRRRGGSRWRYRRVQHPVPAQRLPAVLRRRRQVAELSRSLPSRFDVEKGGLQIFGHRRTQNLPQFRLVVDEAQSGDIYAVAVIDELIYGRLSNVLTA